jgi:glutaredoxin-related protein
MNQALETTNRDIRAILRFLEFLYREEYHHKLDQLSLTSIIPDLPTPDSIKIHQFKTEAHPGDALVIAKLSAEEEMTKAISQMEKTVSNYLDSLTVTFEAQVNYLKSFVNLGKFIYLRQTKDFAREGGYQDIDLIKSLRKIQSQKAEQSVTSGQKTESRKRQREKMVP